MDDAALSVGGALLKRRGRSRVTILSVVRQSNYTSYIRQRRNYLDPNTITMLRLQESRLAADLLGAEFRCLNWVDAPNRLLPSELWTVEALPQIGRAVEAFMHSPIYPAQVERLAAELALAVEQMAPQELWLPMALGDHSDHRLVHEAGLLMLSQRRTNARPITVHLYEDLPYATTENSRAAVARLQERGWVARTCVENIDEVFDAKLAALAVYASQFKLSVMDERLRAAAKRGDAGKHSMQYELRHVLEPNSPPKPSGSPSQEHSIVREWAALHARTPILTLIVLPSGHLGDWPEDVAAIRCCFPQARLRLLLADEVAWEMQGRTIDDAAIDVVRLPSGSIAMMRTLTRELRRYARMPRVWVHWSAYQSAGGLKGAIKRRLLAVGPALQVGVLPEFTARLCETSATARGTSPETCER